MMYTPPGVPLYLNKQIDFADNWSIVSRYCHAVIRGDAANLPLRCIDVYTLVYRLTSHECVNIPSVGDDRVYTDALAQQYVAITHLLTDIIRRHVTDVVLPAISDADPVASYTQEWERFHRHLTVFDAIFEYTSSKCPLAHDQEEVLPPRLSVWHIGTDIWAHELLRHKREVLLVFTVGFTNRSREDPSLDSRPVRALLQALVQLGTLSAGPSLIHYTDTFETPYLQAATAHYTTFGSQWISSMTPEKFLVEVGGAVRAELARVGDYALPETIPLVQRTVVGALIQRHVHVLLRSASRWCGDQALWSHLALLFQLMSSLDSTDSLGFELQASVTQMGRNRVESLSEDERRDPVKVFRCMLAVCQHCAECICDVFDRDKNMSAALQRGAREFVNENVIFVTPGQAAQALAHYCDVCLRTTAPADLAAHATGMTSLYLLIDDREEFNTMYSSLLASRLVHRTGGSDTSDLERESYVVSQLRHEDVSSRDATHRWKRMISDIRQSLDTPVQGVEALFLLDILALSSGAWSVALRSDKVPIPRSLTGPLESFSRGYVAAHHKKTLAWVSSWSHGVIALRLNPRQTVDIALSQSQLYVLDQLQANPPACSTQHLVGQRGEGVDTGVNPHVVYAVDALLQANVISAGALSSASVMESLVLGRQLDLRWSAGLASGPARITVLNVDGVTQAPTAAAPAAAASPWPHDARRHVVQAAIVRLLKVRDSTYATVLRDLGLLLTHRFAVDMAMVRAEVGVLRDRGYLEECEETLRFKP